VLYTHLVAQDLDAFITSHEREQPQQQHENLRAGGGGESTASQAQMTRRPSTGRDEMTPLTTRW